MPLKSLTIVAMLMVLVATGRVGATPFAYLPSGAVIDTATDTVVATVAVSASGGVAMNGAGTRVYMVGSAFSDPAGVYAIDTSTNTAIAHVPSTGYGGVAVSPTGDRVYAVRSSGSGGLDVIDAATNSVLTAIPLGDTATCSGVGVAVHPNGSRVYVESNGFVKVIDTATNTVIASVPTANTCCGNCMYSLAVNPSGTRVYASYYSGLYVIDTTTNTFLHTVTGDLGGGSIHLAINPAGTRMYVSNLSGRVSVVDLATDAVITTIPGFSGPRGLAVNPAGTKVYVVQSNSSVVGVIDTATNTWSGLETGSNQGVYGGYGLFIGPYCPGACSDSNQCTDDYCNPVDGTCSYVNNSRPCDDGTFCNGADTCDGAGSCMLHPGDPCTSGSECADVCDEAADTCNEPAATSCTADSDACTDDVCDGSGACVHPPRTACVSSDGCCPLGCTYPTDGDCPVPTFTPTPTATRTPTPTSTPTPTLTSTPDPTPTSTAPPGTCSQPIVIPAAGGDVAGTTVGGADDFDPTCGNNLAPERVYQWTPTVSGWAKISSCGGGIQPAVSTLTGGCAGTEVGCTAQGCAAFQSANVKVTAGETYTIVVDGLNQQQGTFTLHVVPPGTLITRISGKQLLIKDNPNHTKRKIIFMSQDPQLVGSLDFDPSAYGATVQVYNGVGGADSACFNLPTVQGTWIPKSNGYQYKDKAFAFSACSGVTFKNNKSVKVICSAKVKPIDYSLDELTQGSVGVRVTAGPIGYCARFGGTVKKDSGTDPPIAGGKGQFQAKDAAAPIVCPAVPASCP